MAEESTTIDPRLLVEQSAWVRTLARHLVHDPIGAEDVAQETLLAALARPPHDAGDERRLRAWLGRVTHNLAHLALRRGARRRAREETVARPEREDSTADRVVRSTTLRHVVDEVGSLQEPYRTAVVMRYFEGRSTLEIAQLTGATESAVRKRLWRARARLRQSLDTVHGGDRLAWFGSLVLLVNPGASPARLGSGVSGAGLATAAKLTAAAILVAIGGGIAFRSASIEAEHVFVASPETESARLRRLSAPGSTTAPRPDTTSADGRARTRPPGRRYVVPAVPVRIRETPDPITLRGSVVDLAGNPLGGLSIQTLAGGDTVLATTAANGGFLAAVASLPVTLTVVGEGFGAVRTARVERGEAGYHHWLVAAPAVDVGGRVVDSVGHPVRGARVEVELTAETFLELPILADLSRMEPATVATDAAGRFTLGDIPSGPGVLLRTRRPGFLDDLRPVPVQATRALTIQLEAREQELLHLAGFVEDATGTRVPDAKVGVIRGRLLGVSERPAGGWLVVATPVLPAGDFDLPPSPAVAAVATADDDGWFALVDLREDAYSVFAYDPTSLSATAATVVAAGAADVELLAPEAAHATLAGRVIDVDGRPVPGARVRAALALASELGCARISGACTSTDAAGRFVLRGLPERGIELDVEHPGIQAASVRPPVVGRGAELEIRVELLAQVRVRGLEADHVVFLDAAGRELALRGPLRTASRARLFRGRSPVLAAPASAETLVWFAAGAEVGRRKIGLSPDALNDLEP